MKILFVTEESSLLSGGSQNLRNILLNLNQAEYQPILLCPEGELANEVKERGISVFTMKFPELQRVSFKMGRIKVFSIFNLLNNLMRIMPVAGRIKSLINDERVDLISTQSFVAHWLGLIAAKETSKPIVWHIREIPWQDSIFIRWIGKWFVDKVIFISRAVEKEFLNGRKNGRMEVVYDGVETDTFCPGSDDFRTKWGIPADVKLVGFVGRTTASKGLKYFLESARIIGEKLKDVRFVIIGDRIPEGAFLNDNVFSAGKQLNMPRTLRSLDVLCCPYLYEGLGLAVIEALACKTPVIGSESGGIPEILNKGGGILVPPGDSRAMADSIINLLNNGKERQRLAESGRQNVESNFSLSGQLGRLEKIYYEECRNICNCS